jgi:hypothetical protein
MFVIINHKEIGQFAAKGKGKFSIENLRVL